MAYRSIQGLGTSHFSQNLRPAIGITWPRVRRTSTLYLHFHPSKVRYIASSYCGVTPLFPIPAGSAWPRER